MSWTGLWILYVGGYVSDTDCSGLRPWTCSEIHQALHIYPNRCPAKRIDHISTQSWANNDWNASRSIVHSQSVYSARLRIYSHLVQWSKPFGDQAAGNSRVPPETADGRGPQRKHLSNAADNQRDTGRGRKRELNVTERKILGLLPTCSE